jgi:hypothetical protein
MVGQARRAVRSVMVVVLLGEFGQLIDGHGQHPRQPERAQGRRRVASLLDHEDGLAAHADAFLSQ